MIKYNLSKDKFVVDNIDNDFTNNCVDNVRWIRLKDKRGKGK